MSLRTIARLFGIITLLAGLGSVFALPPTSGIHSFTAWAREDEDEEDEHEDEDEEEDEHEEEDEDEDYTAPTSTEKETPKTEKVTVPKTIQTIVRQPVVETYIETEPGYASDGDGDGVVDALDPDPAVTQTAYFTDDDGDSVPNALDTWPGFDDLLAIDPMQDTNNNGILDTFEGV